MGVAGRWILAEHRENSLSQSSPERQQLAWKTARPKPEQAPQDWVPEALARALTDRTPSFWAPAGPQAPSCRRLPESSCDPEMGTVTISISQTRKLRHREAPSPAQVDAARMGGRRLLPQQPVLGLCI